MQFLKIDHIVMVTGALGESVKFYKTLGFQVQQAGERYELFAGDFKIHLYELEKLNVQPFVANPMPGSLSFCMELDTDLEIFLSYLRSQGLEVADGGLTPRQGVRGAMRSFCLRDPDGNLVEIAGYDI